VNSKDDEDRRIRLLL